MALVDKAYKDLTLNILSEGFSYTDPTRADVELIQLPSYQLKLDVSDGIFPILTTKDVWFKGALVELLWMLSGAIDTTFLNEHGVHIWDEDAKNFSGKNIVGRVYGAQMRTWLPPVTSAGFGDGPVDQIKNLIEGLKATPFNRRHLVVMWNPGELKAMALPPCHWSFEVIPELKGDKISFTLKWHQRSVDTFLGLPFDIVVYALIGNLIARSTGYVFKTLIGDLSNVHFYKPHMGSVLTQLSRDTNIQGPTLDVFGGCHLLNAKLDYFKLVDYNPLGRLPGKLFTQTTL